MAATPSEPVASSMSVDLRCSSVVANRSRCAFRFVRCTAAADLRRSTVLQPVGVAVSVEKNASGPMTTIPAARSVARPGELDAVQPAPVRFRPPGAARVAMAMARHNDNSRCRLDVADAPFRHAHGSDRAAPLVPHPESIRDSARRLDGSAPGFGRRVGRSSRVRPAILELATAP